MPNSHRTAERATAAVGGIPALPVVIDRRLHRIDLSPLQTLVERVIVRWQPEQIWLFGSRARGDADASSDWDLLVVVPDGIDDAELDPLVGWRLQRSSGVRADVFPCRSTDFREDRDTPNTLAYDAAVDGLLIYER